MNNYDYNLRLRALRQKTAIVGVVGMTACGKKEFDKTVAEKGYLNFTYDYQGIMNDTVLPDSRLGVFSQTKQEQIKKLDGPQLVAAMAEDYELYAQAKNAMFDIHMNVVANKIRIALAEMPTIADKGIVFVQCPLSTEYKYNDMFDVVITLTRPQTYNVNSWWTEYYINGMASQFSQPVALNTLMMNDRLFSKIRFTESVNIANDSDIETFKSWCGQAIDDVVEVLQSR